MTLCPRSWLTSKYEEKAHACDNAWLQHRSDRMTGVGARFHSKRLTSLHRKHNREEWMREVELSQRNTVFPDTARNEADFWRRLQGRKLSSIQAFGLLILAATVFAILFLVAKDMLSSPLQAVVFIVLSTLAFLLLRWRVRKALQKGYPDK